MIERAMRGETLEVWGDPNYSKDMVYVDDFSQELCLAALAERDGGFYNIGTGNPISLREQVETIADVFAPASGRSEVVYRPELPSGGGFLMDVQNAKDELGYEPKYGCRELFEAYKAEMAIDRFASLRMKAED